MISKFSLENFFETLGVSKDFYCCDYRKGDSQSLKAALNNKLPLSRRNQPSSTEYRAAQFGNLLLSAP